MTNLEALENDLKKGIELLSIDFLLSLTYGDTIGSDLDCYEVLDQQDGFMTLTPFINTNYLFIVSLKTKKVAGVTSNHLLHNIIKQI